MVKKRMVSEESALLVEASGAGASSYNAQGGGDYRSVGATIQLLEASWERISQTN
jgi:hypothetical protein